ncbi:hypothetical protein WKI65_43620 [Streptomyces sp. MS1.AVA.3]|uniref:hypothetical protein n=1 Tax=Streptomyces decoyicus TaxID=249567 RepID=UPI0030BF74D7
MSAKALVWAMKRTAWCKNSGELAALIAVANFVNADLTGCWASQATLAKKARTSDRTVRTHLRALAERQVIVPGDSSLVSHLPADNRPDVWNLNKALPTEPGTGKDFRSTRSKSGAAATGKNFRSPVGGGAGKFCRERPEDSSDDPGTLDPGTADGDGRRPSTSSYGRSGGGKAASGKAKPPSTKTDPAAIRAVVSALPSPLAAQLEQDWPAGLPLSVNEAVGLAFEDRTVEQVVARVERRWLQWSYEHDALAESGGGLGRPLGVLLTLLGPSACWGNNARCEDGTDIDTGAVCPRCEEARADKAAARRSQKAPPVTGYSVPIQLPTDAGPSPYVQCRGAGCGMKMMPTEDGLCRECRTEGVFT